MIRGCARRLKARSRVDKVPAVPLGAQSVSSSEVRRLVDEYCQTQRHPALPPFVVHSHSLSSWWHTPFSARPGCYAIYGEDGALLYIGKASLNASTGSRLAAHLRQVRPSWSSTPPAYVDIVEVTSPFESPSLEEYLLMKIDTLYNDHGRRRA